MKSNKKLKLMAYLLSVDPDLSKNGKITQKKIAKLFGVTQGTISHWIAEVENELEKARLRNQVNMLQQELNDLKDTMLEMEDIGMLPLLESDDEGEEE